MKYVEFRHLSAEIEAPEVTEPKVDKGVKSWLNSYFTDKSPKSSDPEHEIVDFIKTQQSAPEDGKSYWMSDAAVKSCYNCDKEFSLTRRRHHCRFCGQIFCWKCAPQRSSPIGVRSCQKCLDQRRKSTISPPPARRPSTTFFEKAADLEKLIAEFVASLPVSTSSSSILNPLRSVRSECEFDGLALSRWLSSKGLAVEQIGTRLLEQNMIVNDEGVNEFAADATVYRVVKTREDFVMEADETQELLDCALKDDTEDKLPQLIRDECLNCISPLLLEMSTMRPLEPSAICPDEKDNAIYVKHANETERLVLGDNHWRLAAMARQIATSIAPEAIRDAFDPRSLVHVKKHVVEGGADSTTLYDGAALSGKVFTPPDWSPPNGRDLKVLLIDVPIEFRRDQTRLESLDDLLMQEKEWLSHCCARLVTRHPDVVFMAQSISHFAKQLLLKTGSVRVVTSVKPSALKRLQAATMAEVITTIEEIRTAKMGRTPHMSCLVQIGAEALIMVRSLLPGRQFSVLIKGANAAVLSSIQKCLAHLVLQAYQALCELAYFATRSRGRLDLAQHQQRQTECTCETSTGGFTERMLQGKKKVQVELDRAHLGDLSPMISIEPIRLDKRQIERRADQTEHLLNNLQTGMVKRHRFAIAPPLATEPHPFTAANSVLSGIDADVAAADFRSRGSYPVVDHCQRQDEVERGEMMASSYNATLDKIYEYALAYSSYCLGREDTLLCAEPSVVPLVPYSSQDISLRQFIVQLGHGDLCAHCALPNRLHIRRMVYAGRALHVMFITSRAKLAEGDFITWGADQSRPSRVSPLLATMSVAAFLRLLLAPGTPETTKTEIVRATHYFATGHIICAIKPFSLATLSVQSPMVQLSCEERLWPLEPCRTELEELQADGYALLEQIEKASQDKKELADFFDQAKGVFREAIEVVLVKYGEIRTKESVKWAVLCDMYNQLGHVGQTMATINGKWLEMMKRVVQDETEEEADTDLPEIISTPLNYVNNLLHTNKLSHERHFFPSNGSIVFPIREDEPTSIYAHALANEQLLKPCETGGAMTLTLDAFLTCKIYHYGAFKRLWTAVGLDVNGFITSIMRCTKWEAKGGKSGAKFYKSHDSRFVVKHIGAKEVKTIVEKGEMYIDYMINSDKPSCLAKILGVFQVQMKQNEAIKSHYIVMEDIFYGKTICKTYDLKGSQRNRMSKEEHIFLDSNFINQMRDHPVYIDKASQLVLNNAILNDADFLSSHSIIDYSLLVGVDEKNDKLYIGIIDFIRTFTWDKKVEYEIKTHFTPGSTPPTILHPNKYKERFVESIKKYFNHSPNYYDRTLALKMPSV